MEFNSGIEYTERNWIETKSMVGDWSEDLDEVLEPTYRMRPKWDLETNGFV